MIISNIQKEGLIKTLNEAAFVLETVAHLQGKEKDLLPFASNCRAGARFLSQITGSSTSRPASSVEGNF